MQFVIICDLAPVRTHRGDEFLILFEVDDLNSRRRSRRFDGDYITHQNDGFFLIVCKNDVERLGFVQNRDRRGRVGERRSELFAVGFRLIRHRRDAHALSVFENEDDIVAVSIFVDDHKSDRVLIFIKSESSRDVFAERDAFIGSKSAAFAL